MVANGRLRMEVPEQLVVDTSKTRWGPWNLMKSEAFVRFAGKTLNIGKMSSDQLANRRPSEWILSIFRFKPWTDEDLSLSCWKPCGFARYSQLAMVPGQRFGFLTMTSPPVMGVKMENTNTLHILACDVGFYSLAAEWDRSDRVI